MRTPGSAVLSAPTHNARSAHGSWFLTLRGLIVIASLAPAEAAQLPERAGVISWLQSLDGSVEFQAESVEIRDFALRDVRIPMKLSTGIATVDGGTVRSGPDEIAIRGRYEFATNDLQLAADGGSLVLPERADPERTDGRVFSDIPFLPSGLPRVNGGLELRFDRIASGATTMTDATIIAAFSPDGVTAELEAGFANGPLVVNFGHDYATTQTRFDGRGGGIALERIPLFSDYLSDAQADFEISVTGFGNTPRAVAAHSNAALRLKVGPGTINNLELDRLTQNLLAMTLWSVIPFREQTRETRLECADMRVDIVDGRAATDRGLVIRTEKIELTGRGSIDLDTEQIALELSPEVNDGLSIASTGETRTVSIIGSLGAPSLKASAGSLLHESLALGTTWATSPISRAAGSVLEWTKLPAAPCADLFAQ